MRVLAFPILALVIGCSSGGSSTSASSSSSSSSGACTPPSGQVDTVDPASAHELVLPEKSPAIEGVFDPSMIGTADGSLALVYSVVPTQDAIFQRAARSTDGGATWTQLGPVNTPLDFAWNDATYCNGKAPCPARVIHETGSIVEDPSDDPSRRFKVFTHAYVLRPGSAPVELHYIDGIIEIAAAPALEGPWSTIGKLGWNVTGAPQEVVGGTTQNLASLEGLGDCLFFTEPGALVKDDGLHLALGCVTAKGIRVVRVRSLDHAKTWSFQTTILGEDDGPRLGGTVAQVNGADLFTACGKEYVVASPAGPVAKIGGKDFIGYDACVVMEVDPVSGAVVRDGVQPHVVRTLRGPGNKFTGACTFSDKATTGYLVPELDIAPPYVHFHVYESGTGP